MVKALSFFVFLVSSPVAAQNLTEMVMEGVAREGASRAEEMLRQAPEQIQEYLKDRNQEFSTEQECLGELQLLTNAGALVSNIMPFSSVWAYESGNVLHTRLRLLINGEKLHADFSCDGMNLIGDVLEWDASLPDQPEYVANTLDAGLGAFLMMNQRGVFERNSSPPVTPNDPPSTSEVPGLPLTQAETDGFRASVQDCWVVDVGTPSASVTVTVGFDMDPSGQVVASSIVLSSASGGSGSVVEAAFQAARKAILRCQGDGYALPISKYDQWKTVELTFNPQSMRVR